MTEPEQPANPPLTRKQLREIRNTGATPVITADGDADEAAVTDQTQPDAPSESHPADAPAREAAPAPAPVAVAPRPRPAEPVPVPPAPVADSSVDLGASPLTRRQARQQERIRTASVPVITPEVAAAHTASIAAQAPSAPLTRDEPVSTHSGMHDLFGLATSPAPVAPRADESAEPEIVVDATSDDASVDAVTGDPATIAAPEADSSSDDGLDMSGPADEPVSPWAEISTATEDEKQKDRVVNPMLGAGLLTGEPEQADLPPSFDQLLARSTGSVSVPNALILSQAPEVPPISAPMSATGEVLITGTLNLPEGLGSTGHARGTADGKEVDATLIDGELPAHSSPTPIAASAAISTVKTAGEVIRPPVPEKGSKLMLTLAITAGALALALVGVLILAFVTGAL